MDTPESAYTTVSYESGDEMQLVFSDEFNTDGRTFYPGEDPYWEAVDLHYWGVCTFFYALYHIANAFGVDEQHGMVRSVGDHNGRWLPPHHPLRTGCPRSGL